MRPLFCCLFTASRYFPQFEPVYGAKSVKNVSSSGIVKLGNVLDGETSCNNPSANEAVISCQGFLFIKQRPLCYAVSQVKVCKVSLDIVSSHPSSLEVWKYSVTRPPPFPPPPPFQNDLSISDKQLHQSRGPSSVNTELLDTIHQ